MIRPCRLALAILLGVVAEFGCVHTYQAPSSSEPHAILKVRRTYEKTAGAELTETLLIGEDLAHSNVIASAMAVTPLTDAILIHPLPAELSLRSRFTHRVVRPVLEQHWDHMPYHTMESYPCGGRGHYRSCLRSVTRYRSVPRMRWVMRTMIVDDGSCQQALSLNPLQGATYLLQYTYQDAGSCSLVCYEQRAGADGAVTQVHCQQSP